MNLFYALVGLVAIFVALCVWASCLNIHPEIEAPEDMREKHTYDVEIGGLTFDAYDHHDAAKQAAAWLEKHHHDISLFVGDTRELNDPIHPFMSRHEIKVDGDKIETIF